MGEPGFWDDQASAARVSSEHARLSKRLERYDELTREYEDARELLALDGDMADEIARALRPLRDELDRLQEEALFTGEYDTGDALLSLHAATGGVDAQDFTEMLLRMYLRWAADRGLQDRPAGGDARGGGGPEVGDPQRRRRERIRDPQGRAREAPARAPLAVRPGPSPPHVVRAGRRRAAAARRRRARDRRERAPHRHVPGERRRRPAREQDRLGGADHPPADRHRRPVPERALPDGEQEHRDADAALAARGAPARAARGRAGPRARRGRRHRLRRRQHPQLRPPALYRRSRTTGRATRSGTPSGS